MNKLSVNKAIDKIKEVGKRKLDGSITIRIDNETKEEFEKVCSAMGLSISSAISSFINKVVNIGGIPYSLTTKKSKRALGIANGKYNIDYDEFNKLDEDIIKMFEA